MNPLAACSIATRAEVWVCPLCNRVLAKGIDGSSYIDPGMRCPGTSDPRKPLPRGTKVRYRTVGRAVVEQHTCPDTYPCWRPPSGDPLHQYALRFTTGRYRGTVRNCWVRHGEQVS